MNCSKVFCSRVILFTLTAVAVLLLKYILTSNKPSVCGKKKGTVILDVAFCEGGVSPWGENIDSNSLLNTLRINLDVVLSTKSTSNFVSKFEKLETDSTSKLRTQLPVFIFAFDVDSTNNT